MSEGQRVAGVHRRSVMLASGRYAMLDDGNDPSHIMEDQQLGRMDDESELARLVTQTIESYPVEVARYQAGEEQLLKYLIGMVMKASEGTADPGIIKNMLLVELKSE